ncbi:hypothetical protein [Streptomyces pactum]|uniref:Uncharacterized protein n=1 Tax=Streptomyces pactum TaxID=68249 RepID=A0A1S6J7P3_9ACTN|nr:hypothetical protein [Streptomyces pactum]AQS67792.1 hypothetical protein B1H29_13425 [Streptomyces pactum]
MSSSEIVIHDSVNDAQAELWFAEPAGFTALPLDALLAEPDSPAAERMRTAVAPVLEAAPSEAVRHRLITQVASGQQMLGALYASGTVHCSIGLHRDDVDAMRSGTHLLSLFTISWRETNVAPRSVTAARAVTSVEGHTRVAFLEAPCGPAVLSETTLRSADGGALPQRPLLQVHAHLPHPDCRRLAVLTLSTTATARREEYRAILRQVVETVRFVHPLGGDS